MKLRIFANIVLFVSVLFLPWWITALLGVIVAFTYTAYELFGWGIFADSLYSVPLDAFSNIQFLFTLYFFVLFVVVIFIKRKTIFYQT